MKFNLRNVNDIHAEKTSPIEKFCQKIANWTGAPIALMAAVVLQIMWIAIGSLTHLDPFPFIFLLTCSNVLQLILIFVIAVASKQQNDHATIRADEDHKAITQIVENQEEILSFLKRQ